MKDQIVISVHITIIYKAMCEHEIRISYVITHELTPCIFFLKIPYTHFTRARDSWRIRAHDLCIMTWNEAVRKM